MVLIARQYLVDLRLAIDSFDPRTSHSLYYRHHPQLRMVVSMVTLQKIIECTFIMPASALQEHGISGALHAYIEHNCIPVLEMFEQEVELLYQFEILVNDIVELTDSVLKEAIRRVPADYENLVFENWITPTLAVFVE